MAEVTIWRVGVPEVFVWQLPIIPNPDVPGDYIFVGEDGQTPFTGEDGTGTFIPES